MQRKLNVKLVLWTCAVVIVVAGVLHFVHFLQMGRNAESLLRQSKRALDEGRSDLALRHMRHYLAFRPDDVETLARYSLLLDKTGSVDPLHTVLQMEEVVRKDPDNTRVRHRLVHLLIYLERLPDAVTHLKQLLNTYEPRAEIEHMLGWCLEAQNEYQEAARWFEKAIADDPHRLESYTLLADILQHRLDDHDQARKVMQRMIDANPKSHRAHLARADFESKTGDLADAEAELTRAYALAPDDAGVLLAKANWLQKNHKSDEARATLRRALKLHPAEVQLYLALAGLEMRAGHSDEALKLARKGLEKTPHSLDLRVLVADLLLDEGALDAAEPYLRELKRIDANAGTCRFFDARVAIAHHEWNKAARILEKLRMDMSPGWDRANRVHALLGLCYQHLGDIEQQLASFRRAVLIDPNWLPAVLGLGSALLQAERYDEALQQLHRLSENPAAPPSVWTEIARATLAKNLRLPEKQRNWQTVEDALAVAERKQPGKLEPIILRAEMLALRWQLDQANSLLEAALKEHDKSVPLRCALAELARQRRDFQRADEILDQARKELGDSLDLRQTRTRLALAHTGAQREQRLQAISTDLDALPAGDRTRLLSELAAHWIALRQPDRAEQALKRLTADNPKDARSRFLLAELNIDAGNFEQARTYLKELDSIEGIKGVQARFGKALLLVAESAAGNNADPKKLDQARAFLESIRLVQADWQRLPLLEARIEELQGNIDQALNLRQRAFELGARDPQFVRRLLHVLQKRRRYAEAERILLKIEEEGKLTRDLALVGAEVALANHNHTRALELAELAMPVRTRDYRDSLWRANLLARAGKEAEANKLLHDAIKLAPHAPDAWVALVRFLASHHQRSEAEKVLEQARSQLPEARRPLALARCYASLGQPEQAAHWYQEALKASPGDFLTLASAAKFYIRNDEPARAEPLLRKLLDPGIAAPVELVRDALRRLVVLLGSENTNVNSVRYAQALELLERNRKLTGPNPTDDRLRMLLRATDPTQRQQALQAFDAARLVNPATDMELFWFAQLTDASEDLAHARNVLLDLIARNPDNPRYLAFYIRSLLRNGEIAEARVYLRRLEHIEPDSTRTQALKKRLPQ